MPVDDLNLTRRGAAQMDRVLVNPGRVRAPEESNEAGAFLNQINQLGGSLGGILAKRGAEKRQLEDQEMDRQARIAAFDPEGHERGLAAGIYREWHNPKYQIAVDGYRAENDAVKFSERLSAFDPSKGGAAAETLIDELQAEAQQNPSTAYQAAMLPILAQRGAELRARVNNHQLQVQKEETVANYMAGTNATVTAAIKAGASPEQLYAALNERMSVAVEHGLSRADAATGLLKSAQAAVAEDPALADVMEDYVVPGIGRLGDVAPGAIDDVADQARKSRLAEARAQRADAAATLSLRGDAAQFNWMQAVRAGKDPSPEDVTYALVADPFFDKKVASYVTSVRNAADIVPDPITGTRARYAARTNGLTLGAIEQGVRDGKWGGTFAGQLVTDMTSGESAKSALNSAEVKDAFGDRYRRQILATSGALVPSDHPDHDAWNAEAESIIEEERALAAMRVAEMADANQVAGMELATLARAGQQEAMARAQERLADAAQAPRFRSRELPPIDKSVYPALQRFPRGLAAYRAIHGAAAENTDIAARIEQVDSSSLEQLIAGLQSEDSAMDLPVQAWVDQLRGDLGLDADEVSDATFLSALYFYMTASSGNTGE